MTRTSLSRRAACEAVATAFLLIAVIGSGIMASRLTDDDAIALLANSLATGGALVALILTFGSISGAHMNPAVTIAEASERALPWKEVPAYLVAQAAGALGGTAVAHAMFELPLLQAGTHTRSGSALRVGEFVATFGLLATIRGCSRLRSTAVPFAVAAYIVGAYWFTSSTSFANPIVTVARACTDTFAGLRPADAPAFVAAQMGGALAATAFFRWVLTDLGSRLETTP